MEEKEMVHSTCDICGKIYWLKDLIETKRKIFGYDYTKRSGDIKENVTIQKSLVCNNCIKLMNDGNGVPEGLMYNDNIAMRE
ncbi:MAG: hypothetical protein WC516_08790 [Patescibacteria group bacterium]|jgi:hypothetical protein